MKKEARSVNLSFQECMLGATLSGGGNDDRRKKASISNHRNLGKKHREGNLVQITSEAVKTILDGQLYEEKERAWWRPGIRVSDQIKKRTYGEGTAR